MDFNTVDSVFCRTFKRSALAAILNIGATPEYNLLSEVVRKETKLITISPSNDGGFCAKDLQAV